MEVVKCQTCGIETHDLYNHHIVAKSNGGIDYAGNLISICGVCHGKIHNKPDMSYLTAFENRHGFSFVEYMKINDSCFSDSEICNNLSINKELLKTLKRLAGINHQNKIKTYIEKNDCAWWEYLPHGYQKKQHEG